MHLVFILANRRDIFFVHGGFSPYNGRLCLVHLHIFPTRACHVRNWAPSSRNWRNHGHGLKGWFMDPNTDHDDYNEGGNEMNDMEKKEEINKPHVRLEKRKEIAT